MATRDLAGLAGPPPEDLARDVREVLPADRTEVTAGGVYCSRHETTSDDLRRTEELLVSHGPVRLLDFNIDRSADRPENVVPTEDADPAAYEGVLRGEHRIFRADHHYDLDVLATASTTPLVRRWLLGLHDRGRPGILEEVARSRWIAQHPDADILLANHLAARATDRSYLESRTVSCMVAAARRNDHVDRPPDELEPDATRLFHACRGIEEAIKAADDPTGFAAAQARWLPALGDWLAGAADPDVAARLDAWADARREEEEEILSRIDRWAEEGRLHRRNEVLWLAAPEIIDNAELYLWVLRNVDPTERPAVQVLRRPLDHVDPDRPERCLYKLRAHDPDVNLIDVFRHLNDRFPGTGFGGRATAGGSRPTDRLGRDAVLEAVEEVIAG